MGAPKKASPEIEKLLEASGLSVLDLARESDAYARSEARKNYGPLPDEHTPDLIEELEMAAGMRVAMSAPGLEDDE